MNQADRTGPYQPEDLGVAPAPSASAEQPQWIGRYRVERLLGEGGFGRVYLAHDEQLQRFVAVKVPHRPLVSRSEDAAAYLKEARTVANLDHPHIVPVFDVGGSAACPCFIVSKFIEGRTLAQKIKDDRPAPGEAAELVATVAEALHHAHRKGLVHRDIKPGNILLDTSGQPYVADFGLALREEDVGRGPKYAGTPAYMSPEQARGEGHRVDGRSDIFSLGVVFYELLAGRQPFRADSRDELLEQITTYEPRPLRQIDEDIPKELERICFRALAKRAAERYMTAKDLADDLRHFLVEQTVHPPSAPVGKGVGSALTTPVVQPSSAAGASSPAGTSARTGTTPTPDSQPVKIVPKGLRSFDAQDADFFLELLPGPRDRDGLPDSLRFWKSRIEETDADNTFAVGLIYGPSGCGKSSLVKAGLLPRLSDRVWAVYLEATAGETETRLLNGLRKRCPALPANLGVKETLAALRRGQGLPAGNKVLIVLDQFEQWLHAQKEEDNPSLVQALRQCDGGHVQCLVLVRDDFWLGVSRFLRDLEVRLVEGQNSALADLFDPDHAQKVLAAFGRAFGKLPENPGATRKEHKEFLKEAVKGLAQEGKIICVRLALFAEMMKGKPWTPASLKAVGGTEGVGVTFLEETFSAATAPPEHRYHQKAARAVLKALLPESGTDLKGHMRSFNELLEASGYASRPKDFEDLLRILDREIRLLTPTDPEGQEGGAASLTQVQPGQKYYQLTHDYLVHSLRDWLTRKQKETRQGRAELLLADRASVWNARPENRQLPSFAQWTNIRLLTQKKNWTEPQRQMMRRAGSYHAVRGVVLAVILALVGWGSYEGYGTLKAHALRDRLLDAITTDVPTIVKDMALYRPWIDSLLREAYHEAQANKETRKQLHASLALLPVDPTQVEYLHQRLLDAEAHEVPVLRDALLSHKQELLDQLWSAVEQPVKGREQQRLRAACALAIYDADGPRWPKVSGPVAEQLIAENPVFLGLWMEGFRPVRSKLLVPLGDIFRDAQRRETQRTLAVTILADYAADQPEVLADLLMDADDKQFTVLYAKFTEHGESGTKWLLAELGKQLQPRWTDAPLDPAWKQPAAALVRQLEAAHGVLAERFAFCQSMPLDGFRMLAEGLRQSGYRPIRFRPYAPDKNVFVAAVWTRDGQDWHLVHGLSAADLARQDAAYRTQSFHPVDVTGYTHGDQEQYAALWLKVPAQTLDTEWAVGVDEKHLQTKDAALRKAGYWRATTTLLPATDSSVRSAVLWTRPSGRKPPGPDDSTDNLFTGSEAEYSEENYPADVQVDVQISSAGKLQRRYAAVWHPVAGLTSTGVHGLDPVQHLARCQELLAQGYRPAALAVAAVGAGQPAVTASVWHRPLVPGDAIEKLAKRQANAAVALLKVDQPEKVWPLLQHSPDPRVRSYLIHRLSPLGADPRALVKRLEEEKELSSRRGLLLSLGEFGEREWPPAERDALLPQLLDLYRTDPDPGMHGSVAWLLRQWGQKDKLQQIDRELATGKVEGPRRWYVNGQGQTFALIPGGDFHMGSPRAEDQREGGVEGGVETLHRRRIGRTFALATHVVTVEQFLRFGKDHAYYRRFAPTADCPVNLISWYEAVAYCNWLSDQEGIPKDQWCYEPNTEGQYRQGMKLKARYLSLSGYRLPTGAEWEYACRAGSLTSRSYGETEELLGKYAWYLNNSLFLRTMPVGSLKPNDWGLFDMQGSIWQWTHERASEYSPGRGGQPREDEDPMEAMSDSTTLVMRGGTSFVPAAMVRSAYRHRYVPTARTVFLGFRPARTVR